MPDELTLKQDAFAMAYMETGNASEAYRRAYNAENMKQATVERSACEVFQNPKVSARVTELRAAMAKRNEITVDWVLQGLKENYQRAMHAIAVLDSNGQATGEYTYQGSVANRALELIGKHLGMFGDRDTRADQPVQITRVTIVLPTETVDGGVQVVEGQGHVVEGQGHAIVSDDHAREDESYANAS
jgi:hypothetical protein